MMSEILPVTLRANLIESLDNAKHFVANHADDFELGGHIDGKVSGWLVKNKTSIRTS